MVFTLNFLLILHFNSSVTVSHTLNINSQVQGDSKRWTQFQFAIFPEIFVVPVF